MAIHSSEFECVYVTATDTEHTPADAIDGAQNVSIDRSVAMSERTKQGQKVATFVPGVTTVAISVDGLIERGSAPYGALKTAFEGRTQVFLTVIEDESAGVGEEKGKRYATYVESLNFSYATGDLLKFNASFSLASETITSVQGA